MERAHTQYLRYRLEGVLFWDPLFIFAVGIRARTHFKTLCGSSYLAQNVSQEHEHE